ncbi:uncharacterized protein PV09_09050 [Verruconis gallopava]|uniref:Uncharacterized protein n=1 Tax=Verruconis gallopava TaxID=253628 RepID=A0A0D1ZXU2_9PEZI|nr:uncharacterized protein PV09_09050 [Verruconis gallopava]KIV99282.1 hypothetical protein PV09_09050 [Verruconis gallopava]
MVFSFQLDGLPEPGAWHYPLGKQCLTTVRQELRPGTLDRPATGVVLGRECLVGPPGALRQPASTDDQPDLRLPTLSRARIVARNKERRAGSDSGSKWPRLTIAGCGDQKPIKFCRSSKDAVDGLAPLRVVEA